MKAVRDRIRALFLSNLGRKLTREQIIAAARDPESGKEPENWHQRLSELRTDEGYTILSYRDDATLRPGEYLMRSAERRALAAERVRPTKEVWRLVLGHARHTCEWPGCGLREGDIDPVGGGTVRLTPDHKVPHSIDPASDPANVTAWQALCGRHQVTKKNLWDDTTGKLNVVAILQAMSDDDKLTALEFLKGYFPDR